MKENIVQGRGVSRWAQFWCIAAAGILIASLVSHFSARWLGLQSSTPVYRRIGPESGPQAFLAGSSLLQFGLSWPAVSEALGEGIECWAIGGSSPDVWEGFQRTQSNSNLLIVGFSVYDLNEEHLSDHRAENVPLVQTVRELVNTGSDLQYSRRFLSQYPLSLVRMLFPTTGQSDAVLVGIRRNMLQLVRSAPASEENNNAMVLPKQPTLDFGASTEKLSDWPADKRLRRLSLIRSEIHGLHRFDGLQKAALLRMMDYANQRGRILVVVMPVAPAYSQEFLNADTDRRLDEAMDDAKKAVPQAEIVRLDRLPKLRSDEYYSDFIHLNGAGRDIATEAFLTQIHKEFQRP